MIEIAPELLSFLKQEEMRGRNSELLDRAETALKSYNGDYYGDEVDGCSKVVSRDVAEVVDHMNVSVLRTFVSGDRVVEFEPDNEEQEQIADDATEAIHRQFQRQGYALLHDWLKEGNISTLGVVKAAAHQVKKRTEVVTADTEGAIEAESLGVDPETGVEMYRAIVLEDAPVEFKDYLVPLEEFLIAPDARDPDEAAYIAHACPKTISELVEMGFDRDEVEGISGHWSPDEMSNARGNENWDSDRSGAMRKVLLLEEYVRFDGDGDGIAERLCVHRVDNTVLRVEEVDYQPFVIYCPFPMPGRLAGHSLADKVTDIQRVNTRLTRLYLDGLAISVAPRHWVPDEIVTENTYDDLLTVIPGGLVRGRGPVGPVPIRNSDVSTSVLQGIEFMIGQRESRTGITRLNQGLDADAMNKTATGTALLQAQGQQIEEYLARNFGEALSRLMRLKLMLMSRYGAPSKLRVDGEYRDIDPQQWPDTMSVVIRVGLGSGRKEQRLANRMMLLQIQREVMMAGLPIVGKEQLYKSIAGVVKDANLGSPQDFVIDPETLKVQNPETGEMEDPPEQSGPDPEEQKLMAETQLQAAKMQGEQQLAESRLQAEQMIQSAKIDAMREDASLKAELARLVAAEQAQLARDKAEAESELARQKFAIEIEMEDRRMEMEDRRMEREAQRRERETDVKMSKNRSGGDLDK